MNIFLLSPNIKESCQELAELDPIRARKQLADLNAKKDSK